MKYATPIALVACIGLVGWITYIQQAMLDEIRGIRMEMVSNAWHAMPADRKTKIQALPNAEIRKAYLRSTVSGVSGTVDVNNN
jgi:hypothetical protein